MILTQSFSAKQRKSKAGPHQQQCRSNMVEATGNFVAYCFDNVAVLGNNVEATFDFVERTKFQRKTRSTLLPFLATKSNFASTLLLVWTGLKMTVCIGVSSLTLFSVPWLWSLSRNAVTCVARWCSSWSTWLFFTDANFTLQPETHTHTHRHRLRFSDRFLGEPGYCRV